MCFSCYDMLKLSVVKKVLSWLCWSDIVAQHILPTPLHTLRKCCTGIFQLFQIGFDYCCLHCLCSVLLRGKACLSLPRPDCPALICPYCISGYDRTEGSSLINSAIWTRLKTSSFVLHGVHMHMCFLIIIIIIIFLGQRSAASGRHWMSFLEDASD